MQAFSCFTFEQDRSVPTLTFIVTASLDRARALVRKELLNDPAVVAVEICDGPRLLWREASEPLDT